MTTSQNFSMLFRIFSILLLVSLFFSCGENQPSEPTLSKVSIKKVNGKYDFYIGDEVFKIKGAGLDVNNGKDFNSLAEAGANIFRTWRSDNAQMELDSAMKYNLKIAMGLEMGQELHHFDYNDEAAVAKQLAHLKKEVDKHKDLSLIHISEPTRPY